MGLETGNYIDDLVITNPVGGTDNVSEGDDHIRLLKKTVKATFPNITGPVTLTQSQINALPESGIDETITGDWDFTGAPTIDGVNISTQQVEVIEDNDDRTVLASDVGKCIYKHSGVDATYTLTNSNFVVGDMIMFHSADVSNVLNIVMSGANLRQDITGDTGNFTLEGFGRAVLHKVSLSYWSVSVVGLA